MWSTRARTAGVGGGAGAAGAGGGVVVLEGAGGGAADGGAAEAAAVGAPAANAGGGADEGATAGAGVALGDVDVSSRPRCPPLVDGEGEATWSCGAKGKQNSSKYTCRDVMTRCDTGS